LKVRGWFSIQAVANAGNLVRIEDGCATVTGYKLPSATGFFVEPGRREKGLKPGSQDISAVTLVGLLHMQGHFSDKEKDEASSLKRFFQRIL
jgi:hypothetical protein